MILLLLRLFFLLLQERRPRNARLWYLPAQPTRATFRATIQPWASIRKRAATTTTTTTIAATTGTTTVTVAINVTITPTTFGSGVGGVGAVGGVCADTSAGAAEGDGEVFGRDELKERRMLIGLACADDGDLVERAWGEPWLDHTPDSGEGRRRVDDDKLAHTNMKWIGYYV